MEKFSLITHPLGPEDYAWLFPPTKYLPKTILERAARFLPPFQFSELRGIKSPYAEVVGEVRCCPLTTQDFLCLPSAVTLRKIIDVLKFAKKKGAQIAGIGAWNGLIGDRGKAVAHEVGIPVTTGASLTIFLALEAVKSALRIRKIDWDTVNPAILGVTGLGDSVSVSARLLARECRYLTIAVREYGKLDKTAAEILFETGVAVRTSANFREVVQQADVLLAFTAAEDFFAEIEPDDLKAGAVVCDVFWPRKLAKKVARKRRDVLVIEDVVASLPGRVEGDLGWGFSPAKCPAWMAEVIVLALEKKFTSYSLGYEISVGQVEEIGFLAQKHGLMPGFIPAGV